MLALPVVSNNTLSLVEGESYFLDVLMNDYELGFLRDLSDRIGGRLFREWKVANRVKFSFCQYVGAVKLPSGRSINIYPKLLTKPLSDETTLEFQSVFTSYLNACSALPAYHHKQAMLSASLDVLEQHIYRICVVSNELLRRGLFGRMSREEVVSPSISGKINIVKQLRKGFYHAHRHHCCRNVVSKTHDVSVYIKSGLSLCKCISSNSKNIKLIDNLLRHFADVPHPVGRYALNKPVLTKMERDWSVLVDLLEQIFDNKFGGITSGPDANGEFFLFETEKLFENFISKSLVKSSLVHKIQSKPCRYLGCVADAPMFRLIPDFFIQVRGQDVVVDTKWKFVSPGKFNEISSDDIKQMVTYQQSFKTDKGIFIFPSLARDTISSDFHYFNESKGYSIRAVWLPIKLADNAISNLSWLAF